MNYKLLTKIEVAELLTVSAATIDRMRRQGGFAPSLVIGGTLRWRDIDVVAWVDEKLTDEDRS